MITSDTIQGTEEWLIERAGKISASRFCDILTGTGKPSSSRRKYLLGLAIELVSGAPQVTFKNSWMERGNELEAEAMDTYEFITGNIVKEVGMVYLNEDRRISCSPDGLIGDDGGLEIKCPSPAVHAEYLIKGTIPTKYIPQVQGCMYVTGRKWWDFMSYYPGVKPLIVRVERDEKYIKLLREHLESSLEELDEIVTEIR